MRLPLLLNSISILWVWSKSVVCFIKTWAILHFYYNQLFWLFQALIVPLFVKKSGSSTLIIQTYPSLVVSAQMWATLSKYKISSSKKVIVCLFKAQLTQFETKRDLIWFDRSNWHADKILFLKKLENVYFKNLATISKLWKSQLLETRPYTALKSPNLIFLKKEKKNKKKKKRKKEK